METWTPFPPKPERWWILFSKLLPWVTIGVASLLAYTFYKHRPEFSFSPASNEGEYWVLINAAPPDLTKWILLDDPDESQCPSDVVKSGATSIISIGIITPETCNTELTVFAQGFAPELIQNPAWPTDRVTSADLKPQWSVKLNVVATYPSALTDAQLNVEKASSLFEESRMGIEFVIAMTAELEQDDPLVVNTIRGDSAFESQGHCVQIDEILNSNSTLYQSGMINVFYVAAKRWGDSETTVGRTCTVALHPEIIFIRENPVETLLAHELGHAMSLLHVVDGENVMQNGVFDPEKDLWLNARTFTVGQAYRSNINNSSWLNKSGLRTAAGKGCLDQPSDHWPCPRQLLDWGP